MVIVIVDDIYIYGIIYIGKMESLPTVIGMEYSGISWDIITGKCIYIVNYINIVYIVNIYIYILWSYSV